MSQPRSHYASAGRASAEEERVKLHEKLGGVDNGQRLGVGGTSPRLEGTRVGFLKEIAEWLESKSSEPILWIGGVAGCGKTAVATSIINAQSELSPGAIFYFNAKDQANVYLNGCSCVNENVRVVE